MTMRIWILKVFFFLHMLFSTVSRTSYSSEFGFWVLFLFQSNLITSPTRRCTGRTRHETHRSTSRHTPLIVSTTSPSQGAFNRAWARGAQRHKAKHEACILKLRLQISNKSARPVILKVKLSHICNSLWREFIPIDKYHYCT